MNGDAQYLIGPISKVFTDLLLLKTRLKMQDPITRYLLGQRNNNCPIRWENITLDH